MSYLLEPIMKAVWYKRRESCLWIFMSNKIDGSISCETHGLSNDEDRRGKEEERADRRRNLVMSSREPSVSIVIDLTDGPSNVNIRPCTHTQRHTAIKTQCFLRTHTSPYILGRHRTWGKLYGFHVPALRSSARIGCWDAGTYDQRER